MVTLINTFTVHGDTAEFERVWQESAEFMRARPGFLGYRFGRSTTSENVYVNVAEWESPEALRAATEGPEFQEHRARLRALATSVPAFYTPLLAGEPVG